MPNIAVITTYTLSNGDQSPQVFDFSGRFRHPTLELVDGQLVTFYEFDKLITFNSNVHHKEATCDIVIRDPARGEKITEITQMKKSDSFNLDHRYRCIVKHCGPKVPGTQVRPVAYMSFYIQAPLDMVSNYCGGISWL